MQNKYVTVDVTANNASVSQTATNVTVANTYKTNEPNFASGYPTTTDTSLSGLYKSYDEDGMSSYFRGRVTNNYLKLSKSSSYVWRIVRVNGDGTLRLILNTSIGDYNYNNVYTSGKYVGYTYDNASACTKASPCTTTYNASSKRFSNNKTMTNSNIKTQLETWYKNNLTTFDSYIVNGKFCNDTSNSTIYNNYNGAYERLKENNPSLKCADTTVTYGGYYKTVKLGDKIIGDFNVFFFY